MKVTWVKKLGYLGFLGFLGFYKAPLFMFFQFFWAFYWFKKMKHDELFEKHVNHACRNAFVLTLLVASCFIAMTVALPSLHIQGLAIGITFTVLIFTFMLSLAYYERNSVDVEC
jgi:hypothetical protein